MKFVGTRKILSSNFGKKNLAWVLQLIRNILFFSLKFQNFATVLVLRCLYYEKINFSIIECFRENFYVYAHIRHNAREISKKKQVFYQKGVYLTFESRKKKIFN